MIDENFRSLEGLKQMQAAPLSVKVRMTASRIDDWVYEFGEDGCYISFSGGKDSEVLLHIIRNICGFKKIPAVFCDVPTQYPELKAFAREFDDNLTIIRPQMGFYEVCKKWGFPLISKEISDSVYDAKRFLQKVKDGAPPVTNKGGAERSKRLLGIRGYSRNTEAAGSQEQRGVSGTEEGDYP